MDKTIELLLKIKKLSIHGVGGEKANAKTLLSKLLKKYNISEEDLEVDPFVEVLISKPKKGIQEQLFWQLFNRLYPKNTEKKPAFKIGRKYQLFIPLTFKIEFLEAYRFYWRIFEKDLDIFYYAFLSKNDLLLPADPNKTEDISINPEEEIRIKKALGMSMYLDSNTPKKLIENRR